MTQFTCVNCGRTGGGKDDDVDVRLVEHGTDDVPLCKECFNQFVEFLTTE